VERGTSSRRLSASVYPFYEAAEGCPASALTTAPMAEVAPLILAEGLGVELWVGEYDYRPFTAEAVEALARVCRAADPLTIHTRVEDWRPAALEAEVALAARLGAEVLVVHAGTVGLDALHPPWGAVADFGARARDAGLVLALENSGRMGAAPLRRFVERFGDDPRASGLGICFDTGHAHRSRRLDGLEPAAYVAEFGPAIVEVHVHDNRGEADLHLLPGAGTIRWPPLLEAMRALGPRTVVCIEVKCASTPLGTLRAAREFLRGTP
jgi:sugar phosphate isomerase/epimerase